MGTEPAIALHTPGRHHAQRVAGRRSHSAAAAR